MRDLKLHGNIRTAFLGLLLAGSASATNYYVSNDGKASNPGTSDDSAWSTIATLKAKGIKLVEGDSILFQRGHTFKDSLFVPASGIVVASYGDRWLPKPILSSPGRVIVLNRVSNVIVQQLHLKDGRGGCVEMWDSTTSVITIQDNEMSNCGGGVYASGNVIRIWRNYIHDGKMVVNTPRNTPATMDDDYGASGINLTRVSNVSIQRNRLVNLSAFSYDYGKDGGAIEFWRSARNVHISHNFVYNSAGFVEWGGSKGDSIIDVFIHNNVGFETGIFACLHFPNSSFGVGMRNVAMFNNTIVNRTKSAPFVLYADGTPPLYPTRVRVQNNIFVYDSLSGYMSQWTKPYNKIAIIHSNNLIWSKTNRPDTSVLGPGEFVADPKFYSPVVRSGIFDTVLSHYHLTTNSPAFGSGMIINGNTLNYYKGSIFNTDSTVNLGALPAETPRPVIKVKTAAIDPNAPFVGDQLQWQQRGNVLLLETNASQPTMTSVTTFDLHGRILDQTPPWLAEPGMSVRFIALKSSPTPLLLRVSRAGFPEQVIKLKPRL